MSLTLPAVSSAVPAVLRFGGGTPNLLSLGEAFGHAGFLDDLLGDCEEVTSQSLLRMLASAIRQAVGDSLEYRLIHGAWDVNLNDTEANMISLTLASSVICLPDSQPGILFAERVFSDLETAAPGFGRFAMRVLTDAAFPLGAEMTPMGGLRAAQAMYWAGRVDEAEYEEEWGEDEVSDDTPSRDSIFGGIPPWAIEYDGAVLPYIEPNEARLAVAAIRDGRLAHIASLIVALFDVAADADLVLHDGENSIYDELPISACPFILRWNEDDQLYRPFDDLFHDNMESGSDDRLCYFEVSATIEGVNQCIERIKAVSRLFRLLDDIAIAIQDYQP